METSFFSDFMPHGHCYAWKTSILWTTVGSDLLIAIAYFSIPVALAILTRKRNDLKFKGIIILFALFILMCGITHLISVYTVWHGAYGLHALAKLITAIVSVLTAIVVFRNIRAALAFPTLEQHKRAIDEAADERIKRSVLEAESKAEAIFKFTTQQVPTGLLVIDQSQHIKLANQSAEAMFGFESGELQSVHLSELLPSSDRERHDTLVAHFLESTRSSQAMAAGRVVSGETKSGEAISLEIKIAVHEFEGERYAFANITNLALSEVQKQSQNTHKDRMVRAIEATSEGVWEWDVQTNKVWFSQRMLEQLGLPEDHQATFEDWERHIHPEDKGRVFAELENHLQGDEPYDVIYQGAAGNNQYQWMHCRGSTMFDADGKARLMNGTLSNVNELQILKESLNEKSRFLDHILQKSLCGIYIFSLQTQRNIYINPEYTKITGWTLEELNQYQDKSGSLMNLFHPSDQATMTEHFKQLHTSDDNRGFSIEYRFQHRDGHWLWCYSRDSILLRDNKNEALEILGSFFEITELKQRENQMRELALNFSSTFEQAAVGMAQMDLDGKFIMVNSKFCEMLGYSEEELLALDYKKVTHSSDLKESIKMFSRITDNEINQHIGKKRYIKKDGSLIWAQLTIALVVRDDDIPNHLVSVIEDISERVEIKNMLEASNASLERFAYSASHDLQEPLRKISAFSGLLVDRLQGKLEDKESVFQLERISDAAKRMGQMIQSLLELSRFAHGSITKNHFQLSHLLTQLKDDLAPKLSSTNTEIVLVNDCQLYVEEHSFLQVMRNLILNAIQYARHDTPPMILVKTQEESSVIEIFFDDNGIGFDEKYSSQMFEPFRRLINSHAHKSGTGMGLAICQQIMRSHGGDICAVPLEQGSRFILSLPKGDQLHDTN